MRRVDTATIKKRVQELQPWYQNIHLVEGVTTKYLSGDSELHSDTDTPKPLWQMIMRDLGDIRDSRVLDIGCNAGYMSFECKKLGAAEVVGVDNNFGAHVSFLEQATFCREVLDLDVEFREASVFDLHDESPFNLVLFCGVLYHLENWADALDKIRELVVPGSGKIVLETAIEPVTETFYGTKSYNGDPTTYFVPSLQVLLALLTERGFNINVVHDLGTRGLVFLST